MLSLVNNLASLNAQNNLNNSNMALNTALQRLSSGLRINSGADDPAGLVISQEQLAQMSGLQTAITNTSKATNVVQIADGALNETNSLLLQIRGLAVDAANAGVNDPTSLAADQAQITNAIQTIDRIANTTRFGSRTLLNGTFSGLQTEISGNLTGVTAQTTSTGAAATPTGTYTVSGVTLATAASVVGGVYAGGATSFALNVGQKESFQISDGSNTATVTLDNTAGTNALTVQNVIDAINKVAQTNNLALKASFNATSNKIQIASTAVGSNAQVTISNEDLTGSATNFGGTGFANVAASATPVEGTASYTSTSSIALGVGQTESFTLNDGTNNVAVSLTGAGGAQTVQQVINSINAAATGAGVTISASFDASTDHIKLTASAGTITISGETFSGNTATALTGTGFTDGTSTGTNASATVQDGSGNTLSYTANGNTLTTNTDGLAITLDPTTYNTSGGTTNIIVGKGASLLFQIGSDAGDSASMNLGSVLSTALGQNAAATPGSGETQNQFASLNTIDVTKNASDAIEVIDQAINQVSSLQGNLGAFQNNTLQATATNLQVALQNTTAADSTIRDTNFASETATYTQNQVLVQAGTQVLKNANQLPQLVLALLQ